MNLFFRRAARIEPAAVAPVTGGTMKTIQDFDRELESKQRQYQHLWGEIEQLKMQRAFELQRLAREQARSTPAPSYQPAIWNDAGFVNDFSQEIT
jgi:hypothetical protein